MGLGKGRVLARLGLVGVIGGYRHCEYMVLMAIRLPDAPALRRYDAASHAHPTDSSIAMAEQHQRINGETGAAHPFQPLLVYQQQIHF